jgi:methyltransferase-like protein
MDSYRKPLLQRYNESNDIIYFTIYFIHRFNQKPWKQDVMDKILNKLEMEMVYAEDETMLQSSLTRMEKIEEKFSTFYGPFNIELHKLRTKMLTTYLMLGKSAQEELLSFIL